MIIKKSSLIKEDSWLVENFLDKIKIFAYEKLPWSMENLFGWNIYLIKEKILTCRKLLWSRKNISLWNNHGWWKTSLIKKKYWLMGKYFDHGKTIGLSLLKTKSYDKTNAIVETIRIYIHISIAKMKCKHWTKRCNWSSCTKLLITVSSCELMALKRIRLDV